MDFHQLVSRLPHSKGAAYLLEQGKPVRRPHAQTHAQVVQKTEEMRRWGIRPGMRVGIYAPNSYQWMIHDLALIEIGAISVPFTDDFQGSVNEALLERYHVALLLTVKANAALFPQKPSHVAFMDDENPHAKALDRMPSPEADAADQLSLVFSSGSAGGLKGLVISRKGVEATMPPVMTAIGMRPDDRLLMFLPMSNFQQRNMCYSALWNDFDIIITDYTQLFVAMKTLHPTVLIAPPILFQMIHSDFERLPLARRRRWLRLGRMLSYLPSAKLRIAIARRLFRDFHAQFGDRMRLLVTGMAPIRREMGRFFETMQLPLCESYGMVEAGSITYRPTDCRAFDSVGKPLDGIHITFREDGEILVNRERPMTLRYFQCAEGENERTFIGPGQVATGDIGRFDADGNLVLMGRKKELIITAGGYKLHPEVVEQQINDLPGVIHSVLFLKKEASNLTCVVELDPAAENGDRDRIKKAINTLPSAKKAAQFVEVIFADQPFTRENGLLRPNLKVDRKAIIARYAA